MSVWRRAVHFFGIVKGKAGERSAGAPSSPSVAQSPVALWRSAPTETARLRESKCLQLTSVLTVLHTETKETKRKLQNLLTPTSRSQLSAVRVSFGSSAPLLSPPPILTHTGVFWRTPTHPKKEYTSIIST